MDNRMDEKVVGWSELCKTLGLNKETAMTYREKGLPQYGRNQYPVTKCIKWLIEWEKYKTKKYFKEGKIKLTKEEADQRKAIADAMLKEFELASKRNQIVSQVIVQKEVADVLEQLRAVLRSAPGRYASIFVGIEDKVTSQGRLEMVIDELMEEMSKPPSLPDFSEIEKLENEIYDNSTDGETETEVD